MNTITIEVWDATGNKKQTVELPADAEVHRVVAVLVNRMSLPRHSPDGQLMSYKFHHKGSGRQLLEEETLDSAGIQSGDVLRLQPEITAGCGWNDARRGDEEQALGWKDAVVRVGVLPRGGSDGERQTTRVAGTKTSRSGGVRT